MAAAVAVALLSTLGGAGRAADNDGWGQGVYDACVPPAAARGATDQGARDYCACMVKELRQLPAKQRNALAANSPEVAMASDACRPLAQITESRWNRSAYASCVPEAVGKGASAQGAAAYCACTVKQLDRLPLLQRETLAADAPEALEAADVCRPLAQTGAAH